MCEGECGRLMWLAVVMTEEALTTVAMPTSPKISRLRLWCTNRTTPGLCSRPVSDV